MQQNNDRLLIDVCIGALSEYSPPHVFASVLTVSSVLLLSLNLVVNIYTGLVPVIALLLVILLGIIEMLYAMRVRFDIKLLQKLTHYDDIHRAVQEIDLALFYLKLIKSAENPATIQQRVAGCMALLRRQILLCLGQLAVILTAVAIQQITM